VDLFHKLFEAKFWHPLWLMCIMHYSDGVVCVPAISLSGGVCEEWVGAFATPPTADVVHLLVTTG
jgi:hypothetical protein